jgi:hypothetical protein
MGEPMTADRFAALLAAYGAKPRRWPDAERDAAQVFARTDPRAAALLEDAADIDDLLLAHRVPSPSPMLAAAVIARAPRRRWTRARLWWAAFGLGLAGAGGVLAGSAATAALERPAIAMPLEGHEEATAFGDLAEEGAER